MGIDGDNIVVGAPLGKMGIFPKWVVQGAAYVFSRSGNRWSQTAWLTAPDGAQGDYFGQSVAIDGSTVVVGSPYHTVGSNTKQGSSYVFAYTSNRWSYQATLRSSDGGENDWYGSALAISKDTLVIGARNHDLGSSANQGAAYRYTRAGSSWSLTAKLSTANGAAGELFGASVAISGAMVIAAPLFRSSSQNGIAYVYNATVQEQKLISSNGQQLDHFGSAVAISGNTAVVGANNRNLGFGAAYVFQRTGSGWTQQAMLTPSDGKPWINFGRAVAISGTTIAVAAPGEGTVHSSIIGAIYIFVLENGAWVQQAKLLPPDPSPVSGFGYVMALSGNTLVVSESNYQSHKGAVHVFSRSGTTWAHSAIICASDTTTGDCFGVALALRGNTLVASSPYHNQSKGAVYIFNYDGSEWEQQAKLTASDAKEGDYFGYAVGVNGQSILASSWMKTVGTSEYRGVVYFFVKQGSKWIQQMEFPGPEDMMTFGFRAAMDGSVAVVGSRNQGPVCMYVQQGVTWTFQTELKASDNQQFSAFGKSLALSGSDVIVGADNLDAGTNKGQGAAYIYTLGWS